MMLRRFLPAFLLIPMSLALGAPGALPQETGAAEKRQEQTAPPAKSSPNPGRSKNSSQPFIVFGTVFTADGFALPGAEVRLRRAGEKKDHWQARSDSRGEFAFRVPLDVEYELSVKAAGFEPEARKIDARQGNRVDLTLKLHAASNQKKGKQKPAQGKS
jgi:hypothetical protein